MTGETQTFYVVKVGGDYRILAAESLLAPVASRRRNGSTR
jgi:hypothetical protein